MKRDKLFTSLKLAAAIYILASVLVTAGCNKNDGGGDGGIVGPNGWFGNCLSASCIGVDPNAILLQGVQATNTGTYNFPEGVLNMTFNVYGTFIPPMTQTPINSYSGPVIIRGTMSLNIPLCGIPGGLYEFDTIDAAMVTPGTGTLQSGIQEVGVPVQGMRLLAVQGGVRLDMRLTNAYGSVYGGPSYGGGTGTLGMFVGYGPLSPQNPAVRFSTVAVPGTPMLVIDAVNGMACNAGFTLN